MRTAQEMIEYAKKLQEKRMVSCDNSRTNYYPKAFGEIEKALVQDEVVNYVCIGRTLTRKEGSMVSYVALAITNKRIIFSGQLVGIFKISTITQFVELKNVNSISESYSAVGGSVIIEILGDDWSLQVESREAAGTIRNNIWQAIEKAKNNNVEKVTINTASSADEILKFKNLLDMGIITQEEFDAKKKQLLGL